MHQKSTPPQTCTMCGTRMAQHELHFSGGSRETQHLCCQCYVESGNPPDNDHSECMAAYARMRDAATPVQMVPRIIQDYAEAYLAVHDKDDFWEGYRPFSFRQKWGGLTIEETKIELARLRETLSAMPVWVVSRSNTYPEAQTIAVFSNENDARNFVAKRDSENLWVQMQEVDAWIP